MRSARQIPSPGGEEPTPAPILESKSGRTVAFGQLQSHELLKGIPGGVLAALVEKCKRITLARGDVLLRPGEPNHTLYFLLSGQLEVHLDSRESEHSFPVEAGDVR